MTLLDLLRALADRGVELWTEGDRVRFRAPRGALSSEERAELVARRGEVAAHLREAAQARWQTAPLSFSQQSLWFLHQQAPASTAYHVSFSVRVGSPVDLGALRSAIQGLVDRHATLRTSYRLVDGVPAQHIPGAAPVAFEVRELAGTGEAELRAAVEADYGRPFDLENGPVLRATVFRRAPDDQVLLLAVHHIAADGWSLMILVQEMLALYAEATCGPAASLPRPAVEYADYARWQGEMLRGPEGERLWSFWRGKLTPLPAPLELPGDRPRPAEKSFRGASQALALAPEWTQRVQALARQEGTTPFVVLLACFQALLFRLSGGRDVVVGTPTFARGKAEYLGVVGDFVNSVPLRGALDPATSFRALVRQLRQVVVEALDAQELALSLLVQRLHLPRDPSRSPLFEAFFVLQRFDQFRELQDLMVGDGPGDAVELSGLRLAPYPLAQQEGQFDLGLQMVERGGVLRGALKYSTELFEPATAARIAEGFGALVEAALGAPDGPLGALPAPQVAGGGAAPAAEATAYPRPIPRRGPLPLSSAQHRLWFMDRMEPGRSHYNIGLMLRYRGRLDRQRMGRAVQELVRRQESLRTRFGEHDGVPEVIVDAPAPSLEHVDLSPVPAEKREAEALRRWGERLRLPFDLARGPLARFALLQLGPEEHLLCVALHHAVADGWSAAIVVREIGDHYAALGEGRSIPPPPELQYVDFAAWEREQTQAGRLRAEVAWWQQELEGAPALLELPTDRPRPATLSYRGRRIRRTFSPRLSEALKQLSRQQATTLFTTLLAGLQVLLHRYSGQDDVVVGSPVANRDLPELDGVVGCFVNNLVLRGRLGGNPTFGDFLGQVRSTTVGALDHRHLPFDLLVDAVRPERTLNSTPIFQVLFTLRSFETHLPDMDGVKAELVTEMVDIGAARFDLAVEMIEDRGGLVAIWEYATDLFDEETIARMHAQLERLLGAAAADPARRVQDLPVLAADEERRLLDEWNATGLEHDRSRCLHHLLEASARAHPEAVAVIDRSGRLTYGELEARANRLAHLLVERGVKPGALVAVCVDRSAHMPVAIAAVLKAGAAYVPLDPTHPADRLRYTLEDAGVACAVTLGQFAPLLAGASAPLLLLDEVEGELAARPATPPAVAASPADRAYVIYTSGSTGRPKGVEVEHRNVVSFLEAMRRRPGLAAEDALLAVTTLSFDIAGLEMWLPLMVGARVVIADKTEVLDGERLVRLLEEQQITLIQATPATFRLLLGSGWKGKSDLRALCGGEALPRDLALALVSRVHELWNMYGPTETTIWSTLCRIDDPQAPVTVGRPIENTRVYVLEKTGQPAPIGVPGELCIGGEGVARGYHDRPELTAQKFVTLTLPGGRNDRVYRTGDVARLLADGRIDFLGRCDHQVKVRGHRIELGEIEAVLATHSGVDRCVVVVREDTPGDARLVGYVVEESPGRFVADEARATLRAKVPEYMVPNAFLVLPALPLTPNGKVDRKALPAPEGAARPPAASADDAHMTPVQRKVAAAWRQVLRCERVGLHDNFFDLGGHSLLLVNLHAVLRAELGGDLKLVDLFQWTTVAAQAARLEAARPATGAAPTVEATDASGGALRRARARAASSAEASALRQDAVAIIGMGGRFPGARGLEEFWQNLRQGVESIEEFGEANLEASGVPRALRSNPRYVRRGTVLELADAFDAAFFGYSPREAEVLDPQQRVFLETAWEAMEHAGYAGDCAGRPVGVFAGASINTYAIRQLYTNPGFIALVGGYQIMVGNDKDFLSTRVAYRLDLRGPALTVQTACSTSLVAVVVACRALQRHDCDMALAGGVAIPFPQRGGYLYEEGMILSPDGHCRPFDEAAKGIRPGSGAGVVVLKRLAEALADGDTIHAVIVGAAMNNDGAAKAGYTAPSVEGQVEVIATAQALAGVDPRTIGYLEAHGTGTPLGDPIEVSALTQVFRASTPDVGFCRLGSLKANLGHLDAAAGVASLIKTVLAMEHGEAPPLVHFQRPNPQLALETSPFVVPTAATPWEASGGAPRRAGVSSFGIGGTNAHVVLEEAAPAAPAPAARSAQLLVLSARSEAALERATAELAAHLQGRPDLRLADVAYTLQVGRKTFPHRRALVARDAAQAAAALLRPREAPVLSGVRSGSGRPVAFLFSGQGSQQVGMGQKLYESEPAYREAVDRCARILEPHLGLDLRTILFSPAGEGAIDETRLTQPALFVTEVALAALWAARGVTPSAMLGHSLGEYVAAHLAGVLSLEDALAVVAARGRLMQSMQPGSMAAVQLAAAELGPLLADHPGVEIAGLNAPGLCSVSGPTDAVARLVEQCTARGVGVRLLHTSHGFHSASMEPALAPFRAVVAGVTLSPPRIPYASNLTGTWITAEQATSPDYYAEHLRRAVRFEEGVRVLAADPATLLLEVGPGNALATLARLGLGRDGNRAVATLGHPRERRPEDEAALEAAARLWLAGADLDWKRLHQGEGPRRVPLPTYPYERKRYWVEAGPAVEGRPAPEERARAAALPRREDDPAAWFYAPTWARDDAALSAGRLEGAWLVLAQAGRFGEAVVRAVRTAGASPVALEPGPEFQQVGEARYRVRPGVEEDLRAVARAVGERGEAVRGVLHLWLVGSSAGNAIRVGYQALVAVASALQPSPASPLLVLVATEGAASVLEERVTHPQAAMAMGPVITLPIEVPGLRMRTVDLLAAGRGQVLEAAAVELVAEAASPDAEAVVARRAGRRWVRRVDPVSLPPVEAGNLPLRDQGVYLVTGGLGGIGLTLARWLAGRCSARLLLTARTAMPRRDEWDAWLARHPAGERNATVIRALREMERAGGEVLVAAADAAASAAMAVAIAEARKRWGRLDGVIHAAGISGNDRVAFLKGDSEVRGTFAPKVDGLAVLIQLLGKQPLDFIALVSSVSSLVAGPGQCDYASANAVLDAFPESTSRPERWKRVLVVNYSAWRDVGMATRVNVPEDRRRAWEEMLRGGIPPAGGAEAFARALASGRSQLAISPYDLVEVMARTRRPAAAGREEDRPAGAAEASATEPAAEATEERPALPTPYEAPSTEVERALAVIWSELLGVQQVGVNDDWSLLGGHSLLATRMFSRVEQVTGKNLPLASLLEGGTIRHLAALAGDRPLAAAPVATLPASPASPPAPPAAASAPAAAAEPSEGPSFARLVAIRRQGALPPFFCVHGAGGNVLNLRGLARHMSRERPFFAFQARGLDGWTQPHQTIEDMADEYLAELRTIQPHGPYFLSGYCGGGLVAYEMAQRLQVAGEYIAFLGLIDLYRPGLRLKEPLWRRWRRIVREEDWPTLRRRIRAKVVRDLSFIAADLRIRLVTTFHRTVPHELRDFWLMRGYQMAAGRYALRPFHGRLAVFRARDGMFDLLEDPGPDLGWGGLADGGIEARQVPGNHDTAMRDPNVRELAEQMEDAIAKVKQAQLHRAG